MLLKVCAVLALGLALLVGLVARDLRNTLAYDKVLSFLPPDACQKIDLPTAVEDLSIYNGHYVFAGGGDLHTVFANGSKTATPGAVWLVDTASGEVKQVKITGENVPNKLILHGIFYSKHTKRLYAVQHGDETGESVEVFDVLEENGVKLLHRASIRSELFGNIALNDVVEGLADEIYITEWQPFPFPRGGKAGITNAPFLLKLQRALFVPITTLKIKLTRIFRCTIADGACTVASSERFIGANGIAISEDRQTVFVNDAPGAMVSVMGREADGSLKKVSEIKSKHVLDNIEMSADGKLMGGSIPLPYTSGTVCDEAKDLSMSADMDGRHIGCGHSPGGLLEISPVDTGGKSFVDGTQVDKGIHDGGLLSGISAAVQSGDKIVLGSPFSTGLLICKSWAHHFSGS